MIRYFISVGLLMGAALIFATLISHTYEPASTNSDATEWPLRSQIKVDNSRPILIVFAHPHCPCFAATISGLTTLSDNFSDLQIFVVFTTPNPAPKDWHLGSNWHQVRDAGLASMVDTGCFETHLFKANASGELMLYKDGQRLFHGGITAGRGHSGPSAGMFELIRVMSDFKTSENTYPVFGCPILNDDAKN